MRNMLNNYYIFDTNAPPSTKSVVPVTNDAKSLVK